ncbi:MAG: hypothetical protein MZV63_47510 [Marinilabiliales bacterium]|nr:hypothetical protein [Marinilabiliales bacterium]
MLAWLHRKIISSYDLCLVPDYPGPMNLSGSLSHELKLPGNVYYMGPLSRFRAGALQSLRTAGSMPTHVGTTCRSTHSSLLLPDPLRARAAAFHACLKRSLQAPPRYPAFRI